MHSKYFIKRPFKGLFLFFLFSNCFSFELSSRPFISKVNYLGIKKTQKYVVDREIRHPKNKTLSKFSHQFFHELFLISKKESLTKYYAVGI